MAEEKILVADDDEDLTRSLKAILEGRDYCVVTASSREEGLSKFESEKPEA